MISGFGILGSGIERERFLCFLISDGEWRVKSAAIRYGGAMDPVTTAITTISLGGGSFNRQEFLGSQDF